MKPILLIIFSYLMMTSPKASAQLGKHMFAAEAWSMGRSCLICHNPLNGFPRLLPPNGIALTFASLNPEQKQAFQMNTSNGLCFACHTRDHSPIALLPGTGTGGGGAGTPMPGTPTPIPTPGSPTAPAISGPGMNCLNCHDVHNENSPRMLKQGY